MSRSQSPVLQTSRIRVGGIWFGQTSPKSRKNVFTLAVGAPTVPSRMTVVSGAPGALERNVTKQVSGPAVAGGTVLGAKRTVKFTQTPGGSVSGAAGLVGG